MHRTQIYFEEETIQQLKKISSALNISVSAYIRDVVNESLRKKDIDSKSINFSKFSDIWEGRNISQEELREKAWK